MTTIAEEIERIKSMDTSKLSERDIQNAIVMPMFRALGWNTTDPSEVRMEYKVGKHRTRHADVALLVGNIPSVLIETKPPSDSLETEKYKSQVVEYCLLEQVRMGVLTNGLEWRIYYRQAEANKNFSLSEIINLVHGETEDSEKKIKGILSKETVSDSSALAHAKQLWHDRMLSGLWKDLLVQGDKSLVWRLRKEAKDKYGMDIRFDDVRKFVVSRSDLPDTVTGASTSLMATSQNNQETTLPSPKPKPKKSFRVRVRMFGVESEFKSLRETLINFALQACHQNKEELGKLARCLETDGKRLLMIHSNERPPTLRDPRRIGETNYWLETHFSKADIKRACNRIQQALSLPEDVLVWLD